MNETPVFDNSVTFMTLASCEPYKEWLLLFYCKNETLINV